MNPQEKQSLLDFARRVATAQLGGRDDVEPVPSCAADMICGGLFVTFRRQGKLRGCMGRFAESCPVAELLADVTHSALRDPRFSDSPLTLAELTDADIEISILSPRREVRDVSSLIAGVHGVVVIKDHHTGCFLPQVASERGWSIETLLDECCRQKAGLPASAWRDPGTRIEAFEATILQESSRI